MDELSLLPNQFPSIHARWAPFPISEMPHLGGQKNEVVLSSLKYPGLRAYWIFLVGTPVYHHLGWCKMIPGHGSSRDWFMMSNLPMVNDVLTLHKLHCNPLFTITNHESWLQHAFPHPGDAWPHVASPPSASIGSHPVAARACSRSAGPGPEAAAPVQCSPF